MAEYAHEQNLRLAEKMLEQQGQVNQLTAERDRAYRERAHLLALLAALHPSVIAPAPDIEDEDGWQILYLRIGGKQASWHIAPRDADLFEHVERVTADDPRAQWDGHTTEEKYERIRRLSGLAQPDEPDTCRPVEIDGQTIRVHGDGEMSAESRAALAEVIRAAKRKYEAEHPEASNPAECSGEKGFCPEHGFHRRSLKQPGEAEHLVETAATLQTVVNRVREAVATDQPAYPHRDGDVTVLGPEVFASSDRTTISWQGALYVLEDFPAPIDAPAATEATGAPDTITDPEWLREQYAAVIRQWWDADDGGADEIAAAVMRVRDRHLQQLQQRLALAAAVLDQTQERPAGHIYLSTGCLHGDTVLPDGRTGHEYCQSETGKTGTKTPAQCKFCASPCVCPCHEEQPGA